MLHKTKGIALHTVKYNDNSIIVCIYTELFGRQSYLIKGIHSKKGNIKLNFFQPLSLLELEVYHKNTEELQKLKDVQVKPLLTNIFTDPVKTSIAFFLAEFLYKVIKEESHNDLMFNFLNQSIQWLEIETKPLSNFHLVFLIQFAKYYGIYPNDNYNQLNTIFDLQNGSFLDRYPNHKNYLDKHLSQLFSELLNKQYQHLDEIKIKHQDKQLLIESLIKYYSLHVDGFISLKTLDVLKDVFNN